MFRFIFAGGNDPYHASAPVVASRIQYINVALRSFHSVTHLLTTMTISRAFCSGVCFISGSSFFTSFLWPRLTILIVDLIFLSVPRSVQTLSLNKCKIAEDLSMVLRVIAIRTAFLLLSNQGITRRELRIGKAHE